MSRTAMPATIAKAHSQSPVAFRKKGSGKRRRNNLRDKRPDGAFVPFPSVVLGSTQLAALPADACKALLDLLAQYRLGNNGDLSSAWSLMQARGWRSKDRLQRALAALENAGFIVRTRQGGAHRPTLWGVTIFALDDCGGKLEVTAADWERAHRGLWARTSPIERGTARGFARGVSTSPHAGPIAPASPHVPVRSTERNESITPCARPIPEKSAKLRPGSRSPLKNHHLWKGFSGQPPFAYEQSARVPRFWTKRLDDRGDDHDPMDRRRVN